jgi:hypothetical protein
MATYMLSMIINIIFQIVHVIVYMLGGQPMAQVSQTNRWPNGILYALTRRLTFGSILNGLLYLLVFLALSPSNATPGNNQSVDTLVTTIPRYIHYRGSGLSDSVGNPLAGQFDISVRIYDDVIDPATDSSALWHNTYTDVSIRNGAFELLLGDGERPLPTDAFTSPNRYIGITVHPYTEIQRERFASVPFAFNSDTFDGLDSKNFVLYDDSGHLATRSNLSVHGHMQASGHLVGMQGASVWGNLSVGENLTVDVNADVIGNMTVNQDLQIDQDLAVRGDASITNNLTLQGQFSVGKRYEIFTTNGRLVEMKNFDMCMLTEVRSQTFGGDSGCEVWIDPSPDESVTAFSTPNPRSTPSHAVGPNERRSWLLIARGSHMSCSATCMNFGN